MIVLTGASKGIGAFLFEYFHNNGDKIIGTYNSTPPSKADINDFYKVDITDWSQVQSWFEHIKNRLSQIVLINSAGINYSSYAHKCDINSWRKVIDTNLIGTFNVIHNFLPLMREQNYGRIINFSSVVAQIGVPGTSAYAASKAGLWGLTRSVAVENASRGITINNINIGYFNIGMLNEIRSDMQDHILSKIPTGTFGDPFDLLNAVKFIIDTPYLTGTSIDLNGGLY